MQVLAGAGRAVLGAERETQGVDLVSEGVERAEDLLHAFGAHQELSASGVRRGHVDVGEQLAGIDGALRLGTPLHGQRLNDLAWWALGGEFTF